MLFSSLTLCALALGVATATAAYTASVVDTSTLTGTYMMGYQGERSEQEMTGGTTHTHIHTIAVEVGTRREGMGR